MFFQILRRHIFQNTYTKQLTPHIKNPYINLPLPALKTTISTQLSDPAISIPKINTLIYLSIASQNNKLTTDYYHLIHKCIQKLTTLQNAVNEYQQDNLKQLQLGQFIEVINKQGHTINKKDLQKLTEIFSNTYSQIFSLSKILQIYEHSHKNNKFDQITQIAKQIITEYFQSQQLPQLSIYITYLRLFYTKIQKNQLNQYIQKYAIQRSLCKIQQEQKLILYYIGIYMDANVKILEDMQLMPNLNLGKKQDGKWVCYKLEIMKYKGMNIPDLLQIDLDNWSYRYLIWVSEFCTNQIFAEKLHKYFMQIQIPTNTKPSSIFIYATNTHISPQKHKQINNWLIEQDNISEDHEQDLCNMLKQIHTNSWQPYYKQFYSMVLKMSLGNFQWESQNITYYCGYVQKIEDQNMEYLRRYILNTYASLGTARRQIPTCSYFYKILEVANVQKFYGDL